MKTFLINIVSTTALELWHEATASFKFNLFCMLYSGAMWVLFIWDAIIPAIDWGEFWVNTGLSLIGFIFVRIVGEWAVKKIKYHWERFRKPKPKRKRK